VCEVFLPIQKVKERPFIFLFFFFLSRLFYQPVAFQLTAPLAVGIEWVSVGRDFFFFFFLAAIKIKIKFEKKKRVHNEKGRRRNTHTN
jgi:hypothetical protein